MVDLEELRQNASESLEVFQTLIYERFPGMDEYHWYRAISATNGENVRRNDDQSSDAAMAADLDIKAAHDEHIRLLHIYYRARDGEHGVLGGRGI